MTLGQYLLTFIFFVLFCFWFSPVMVASLWRMSAELLVPSFWKCFLHPCFPTWRVNPFFKRNPARKQVKAEMLWLNIKWNNAGIGNADWLAFHLSLLSFKPLIQVGTIFKDHLPLGWSTHSMHWPFTVLPPCKGNSSLTLPSFPCVLVRVPSETQAQKHMCIQEEIYYKNWLMWLGVLGKQVWNL